MIPSGMTTPENREILQNPTPPTLQKRSHARTFDGDELPSWTNLSHDDVDRLQAQEAKTMLNEAIELSKQLQASLRSLQQSEAHHRFNHAMLKSEQEERMKRHEVEEQIRASERQLLLSKMTYSDEDLFRQRHRKAKRRLLELAEDNRRQQHSVNHLQRQLKELGGTSYNRSDGGLDVLSDAATQMQQMASLMPRLLSPVTFDSPHHVSHGHGDRRESQETVVLGGDEKSTPRRVTRRTNPLTPKSP